MLQIDETMDLSKNFKAKEFMCHNGCPYVRYDYRLILLLQNLRDFIRTPIQIVSGYRTPDYNTKIGGSPKSQHMLGKAADIKIKGYVPREVGIIAGNLGFRGIGVYIYNGHEFTHVDVRENMTLWAEQPDGALKKVMSTIMFPA